MPSKPLYYPCLASSLPAIPPMKENQHPQVHDEMNPCIAGSTSVGTSTSKGHTLFSEGHIDRVKSNISWHVSEHPLAKWPHHSRYASTNLDQGLKFNKKEVSSQRSLTDLKLIALWRQRADKQTRRLSRVLCAATVYRWSEAPQRPQTQ